MLPPLQEAKTRRNIKSGIRLTRFIPPIGFCFKNFLTHRLSKMLKFGSKYLSILFKKGSEKAPLSGCYEIFGVPHLDEANGPKGANPQFFEAVGPSFEDLVSKS